MQRLFYDDDSIDRASELRSDSRTMEDLVASPQARFLMVRGGCVKVSADGQRLGWQPRDETPELAHIGTETVFLGRQGDQTFHIVIAADPPEKIEGAIFGAGWPDGFVGLFEIGRRLSGPESQLAAQAVHYFNWINDTRRCSRCGAVLRGTNGGHKRVCENKGCGAQAYPRTDPAVMALVTIGDRCLLGRQKKFPPGYYAPLAGFVEPGETLEAAVKREVREEVGLLVEAVVYVASQPWPFPGSLMLGCIAQAHTDEISLASGEIEDARWVTRAEIQVLGRGDPAEDADMRLPPVGIIGRLLIDHWVQSSSRASGGPIG